MRRILDRHGLEVVDVDELPTHGGSLRVHGRHAGTGVSASGSRRWCFVSGQRDSRMSTTYASFGARVAASKRSILEFLIGVQRDGKSIAGYGAPGKANTMLNYCGIGPDLLPYTVDRNPYKQGRFMPGSRIPIEHPDRLERDRPDIVWILPWNLRSEIAAQLSHVQDWGGRLFVAMPTPQILEPATPVAGATPMGQGRP